MNKMKTFVVVLLCIMGGYASYGEEVIPIASGEWPPYFSEHLKYHGVGSRIVSEAFALEGVTVVYGFFPWIRSLKLAESGEWDGVVGFELNRDREKHFIPCDPVWEAPWVFFYVKGNGFDWDSFDDLKDVIIGGIRKEDSFHDGLSD